MPYFLFDGIILIDQPFSIKGADSNHIFRSRRIQQGEVISIQDSSFKRYLVEVTEINKRGIVGRPVRQISTPAEPSFRINLFQALVKEKALDNIIQKSTELGVSSIWVFQSHNSQRLNPSIDIAKRLRRWETICREACKQSERLRPPSVHFLPSLDESSLSDSGAGIQMAKNICLSLSGVPDSLKHIPRHEAGLNIFIGPEGGWGEGEPVIDNLSSFHLGPRTLRAETAAITAIGVVQFLFGDFDHSPLTCTVSS